MAQFALYDQITLASSGMLTENTLPPITNGRTVQFVLAEGRTAKEIYTFFDGELTGPFRNGSRLDTPVKLWEQLLPRPHDSLALVVDLRPQQLPAEQMPLHPLCPCLDFGYGAVGQAQIFPRLSASIRCIHPRQLVLDYLAGIFSSPEQKAADTLADAANELLPRLVQKHLESYPPVQAIGSLSEAAPEMVRAIAVRAKQLLPWLKIERCNLELVANNAQQLVQMANRPFEISLETRQKVLDALVAVYTRDPFPPQIAQVVTGYAQTHLDASDADLLRITRSLQAISQQYTPDQILHTSVQLGLIPPPSNSNP